MYRVVFWLGCPLVTGASRKFEGRGVGGLRNPLSILMRFHIRRSLPGTNVVSINAHNFIFDRVNDLPQLLRIPHQHVITPRSV